MKKLLFAIIGIMILVAACASQAPPTPKPAPQPVEQPTPQAPPAPAEEPTAPEQPAQPEQPAPRPVGETPKPSEPIPLYGAIPISKTEDTKPIQIVDYDIERDSDMATLKLVKFTIRNFGGEPIRPRVVMQLSGEGFNVNKIWDYDRLLNGYKYEKEVKLDITLEQAKLMKVMQLTVLDMDKGMKELGSDKRQFVPIPPK